MAALFEEFTDVVGPIRSQSLTRAVSIQLQQLILSGLILPGERINESHFANVFEVSRGPIREACRQLEQYGLVEFRENQGTFVKNITFTEAMELYDIRAALESLSAEKAVQRIQENDFVTLEELVCVMGKHKDSNDKEAYFKSNIDYHFTIFKIAGNSSLLSILEIISNKIYLFRKNTFEQPQDLSNSMKEHKNILKALKKKDGKQAASLIRSHVLRGKKVIQNSGSISQG